MALKKLYMTLITSDAKVLSVVYPVTAFMAKGAGEIVTVKSRTKLASI